MQILTKLTDSEPIKFLEFRIAEYPEGKANTRIVTYIKATVNIKAGQKIKDVYMTDGVVDDVYEFTAPEDLSGVHEEMGSYYLRHNLSYNPLLGHKSKLRVEVDSFSAEVETRFFTQKEHRDQPFIFLGIGAAGVASLVGIYKLLRRRG